VEYAEKGSSKEAPRFKHYNQLHRVYDRYSLKRAATYKYVEDQLLKTF
jgi:hypothetical protein